MDDFAKPILRKKPDQLVLHTGTNDLPRAEPQVVAHGVTNLAHKFEQQLNLYATRITGTFYQTQISIEASHLNSTGLHLNHSGSLLLQNNFKSAIAH